jgi:2,3-diketo-5-methylthio-1-phosphopentane phosphatase
MGHLDARDKAIALKNWTILCDFDGTISVEDVIDSLLDSFGQTGWRTLEHDWCAGRIGSRTCMTGQVALLDMSRDELNTHLDRLWIDRDFAAFVAEARSLNVPLHIVSDGVDYAIDRMLRRDGLDDLPLMANHLLPGPAARTWRLETPHQATGCGAGVCKCAVAASARQRERRVLLIGDGASDFCVADRVDFVFAKNRLIEHCRTMGLPYLPINGFEDALAYLPQLVSGRLTSMRHMAALNA